MVPVFKLIFTLHFVPVVYSASVPSYRDYDTVLVKSVSNSPVRRFSNSPVGTENKDLLMDWSRVEQDDYSRTGSEFVRSVEFSGRDPDTTKYDEYDEYSADGGEYTPSTRRPRETTQTIPSSPNPRRLRFTCAGYTIECEDGSDSVQYPFKCKIVRSSFSSFDSRRTIYTRS